MKYLGLAVVVVLVCVAALAQETDAERMQKVAMAQKLAKEIAMLEEALKQAHEAGEKEKAAMLEVRLMESKARLKMVREELAKPVEPPKEQPKDEPQEKPEEPKKPVGELEWLKSIDEGKKKAKESGAKILVLFTSPTGCPPCDILKGQTFHDEGVKSLLKTFVLVKINAWDRGPGGAEAQKWGVRGIPTIAVLDAEGKELGRTVGYKPPEDFIATLTGIRDADLEIEEGKKKIEADAKDPAGYMQVAKGYAAKGNAGEAQKNYEKAVELDPKDEKGVAAQAYEKLAELLAEKRRFDKAIEAAQKLSDLDPENKKGLPVKAADMISSYYLRLRNVEKFLEYAAKVVELDAENKWEKGLDTAFNLGNYYANKGDAQSAKKYFDIVKKIDPEDKEEHADMMAFALTAVVHAGKEEWDKAIKGGEAFIESHKESKILPSVYRALGVFHYRAGDKDKAKETFNKLIEKFPDSPEAGWAKRVLPRLK